MNEIIESINLENLSEKLDALWYLNMTDEEIDKAVNKIDTLIKDSDDSKLYVAKWLLKHSMIKISSDRSESDENDKI